MNQIDTLLWKSASGATVIPNGGTFTVTLHLTGGDVTTGSINYNDDLPTLQAALDAVSTGGTTAALVSGSDCSNGFTVTYIGPNANTLLTTMTVTPTGLTAPVTAPPQPSQTTAGAVAVQNKWSVAFTFDVSGTTDFSISVDGGSDISVNASWAANTLQDTLTQAPNGLNVTVLDNAGSPTGTATPYSLTFGDSSEHAITVTLDDGAGASVSETQPFMAGVAVVHTLYTQSTVDPATGGTYTLTGDSGPITDIPFDIDGNTLSTSDYPGTTGASPWSGSGTSTQADPAILTGPQQPVNVPTADYSGLTQSPTATPSTTRPGSSANPPGRMMLMGCG